MFKENWTNIPATLAQVKRFFIGTPDQQPPSERPAQRTKAAA